MKIETKFEIGQNVYFAFKEDNLSAVQVLKDKIEEIVINKTEILYYGDKICEEFKEDDIVDINDIDGLIKKIRKLAEKE